MRKQSSLKNGALESFLLVSQCQRQRRGASKSVQPDQTYLPQSRVPPCYRPHRRSSDRALLLNPLLAFPCKNHPILISPHNVLCSSYGCFASACKSMHHSLLARGQWLKLSIADQPAWYGHCQRLPAFQEGRDVQLGKGQLPQLPKDVRKPFSRPPKA